MLGTDFIICDYMTYITSVLCDRSSWLLLI